MEYTKVKSAQRRLLWDFSKPSRKAKGVFVAGAENEDGAAYPAMGYEAGEGADEIQFEFPHGEDGETDDYSLEEDEAEAILMAYQEVRQKLNHKKLARGYFRSGESSKGKGKGTSKGRSAAINIEELKKKTKCRKCGRTGHWARECPGGQSTVGKGAMMAEGESADALASWTMAGEMPFPLGTFFVAESVAPPEVYKDSEVIFGGLSMEYSHSSSGWSLVSGTDCEVDLSKSQSECV
eukprot:4480066-Amphidinium_carterae.2